MVIWTKNNLFFKSVKIAASVLKMTSGVSHVPMFSIPLASVLLLHLVITSWSNLHVWYLSWNQQILLSQQCNKRARVLVWKILFPNVCTTLAGHAALIPLEDVPYYDWTLSTSAFFSLLSSLSSAQSSSLFFCVLGSWIFLFLEFFLLLFGSLVCLFLAVVIRVEMSQTILDGFLQILGCADDEMRHRGKWQGCRGFIGRTGNWVVFWPCGHFAHCIKEQILSFHSNPWKNCLG